MDNANKENIASHNTSEELDTFRIALNKMGLGNSSSKWISLHWADIETSAKKKGYHDEVRKVKKLLELWKSQTETIFKLIRFRHLSLKEMAFEPTKPVWWYCDGTGEYQGSLTHVFVGLGIVTPHSKVFDALERELDAVQAICILDKLVPLLRTLFGNTSFYPDLMRGHWIDWVAEVNDRFDASFQYLARLLVQMDHVSLLKDSQEGTIKSCFNDTSKGALLTSIHRFVRARNVFSKVVHIHLHGQVCSAAFGSFSVTYVSEEEIAEATSYFKTFMCEWVKIKSREKSLINQVLKNKKTSFKELKFALQHVAEKDHNSKMDALLREKKQYIDRLTNAIANFKREMKKTEVHLLLQRTLLIYHQDLEQARELHSKALAKVERDIDEMQRQIKFDRRMKERFGWSESAEALFLHHFNYPSYSLLPSDESMYGLTDDEIEEAKQELEIHFETKKTNLKEFRKKLHQNICSKIEKAMAK